MVFNGACLAPACRQAGQGMEKFHKPVMLQEVLDYLNLGPGKVIVDATIGTAGHSESILKRILPGGRLIGIDRDPESLAVARERLHSFVDNCDFIAANFNQMDTAIKELGMEKIDGALFDLGISSFQLENCQRGFSFQSDGPLDMRMDRSSSISAYDLVNNLNQDELSNLIWAFGQERWHNRIARFLVRERQRQPIATTAQLSNIITRAVPPKYRYYRIHPATRTFQAIRIAVNRELEILEAALEKAIDMLNPSGRICVISFHSLEDRIVKLTLRKQAALQKLKILTPKPLSPQEEETRQNPSSRSSKLRVAERL